MGEVWEDRPFRKLKGWRDFLYQFGFTQFQVFRILIGGLWQRHYIGAGEHSVWYPMIEERRGAIDTESWI